MSKGGIKQAEEVTNAIKAYLAGEGSYGDVAAKYGCTEGALRSGLRRHKQREAGQRVGVPAAMTKAYEKTIKGHLMRTYRNMKSRVTGIQSKKAHLYGGHSLLTKEAFYEWSLKSVDYLQLHNAWVSSNYDQRLTPSIDRIDSSKGYELSNMRWLTHSANSSLGARSLVRDSEQTKAVYRAAGVKHV